MRHILSFHSVLEPAFARIENPRIARRMRLMNRVAVLGFVLAMGSVVAEAVSGIYWLIPCTLAGTLIYILAPFLILITTPTLARIVFVGVGNMCVFAFAAALGAQSAMSNIVIGTMALPALFFETDERLPTLFCVAQTVLFFLVFYLVPLHGLPTGSAILPMQVYTDLAGFALIYFGVRCFQAAEAKSESTLQGLIDALPDLVLALDRQGHYLSYHCPPTMELIVPPKEFLGAHYRDCLPGDLVSKIDSSWQALLETGLPQALVYELQHPDGSIKHYDARMCFAGQTQVLIVCQDVTARVSSERALRESENIFRRIVETTQEGVWMLDENGYTTFTNDRIAAILGYSPQELMGISPVDIADPDFRAFLSARLEVRKKGISEQFDCRFRRKDGAPLWALVSGSPILDEHGKYKGSIKMLVDITERKRMEAEIISSSKMSALGVMSSGIAHEINNPLTIIHGRACQLRQLASAPQPIDPRVVALYAGKIETTAIRISNIVKALRTFSRETNEDPPQICAANTILTDTLELCKERFGDHGITLDVIPASNECVLQCRPAEICQIILNLLNNAHDAVQSLQEKWVRIAVTERDREVEISVTDSGHGIAAEIREKILQPFFTTKDVGKGTGLGLSVSKGLAESHGGRLYLDTNWPNTRFVLVLPSGSRGKRSQSS